jgi:hypothetical protein
MTPYELFAIYLVVGFATGIAMLRTYTVVTLLIFITNMALIMITWPIFWFGYVIFWMIDHDPVLWKKK